VLSRTTKPATPVVAIEVGYLPMLNMLYDVLGPAVSNVARLLSNHMALVASSVVILSNASSDLAPPPAAVAVTVRDNDSSTIVEYSDTANTELVEVEKSPSTAALPPAPASTMESLDTVIVDREATVMVHRPLTPLFRRYQPTFAEVADGVWYVLESDNRLLVWDSSTTSASTSTATATVATFRADAVGYVNMSNVLRLIVNIEERVNLSIAPGLSLRYTYHPTMVPAPS
jgi:hypothetical protein